MPKNGRATMYTSGWPKNQNRCCHSSAPPFAASKMCAPNFRSASSASSAAVSTGKAGSTRIEVNSTFQVKIGIRNMVMPGARRHRTVVMKLTAPSVVDTPVTTSPMVHRSPPAPGLKTALFSGAYANQPKAAAPPGVRNPATTIRPPNRYSQYERALRRGKATSGAPICNGMIALANPANSGVANSSIMIVPWTVKSWLYWCAVNSWRPGRASSARISRARTPPNRKNPKDVVM